MDNLKYLYVKLPVLLSAGAPFLLSVFHMKSWTFSGRCNYISYASIEQATQKTPITCNSLIRTFPHSIVSISSNRVIDLRKQPISKPCAVDSYLCDTTSTMTVTRVSWGTIEGQNVEKLTLKNGHGLEVDVLSYGATIQSIRTPDKQGNIGDVVLGFDNIEGYLRADNPYFGATIGRIANRVGRAVFNLDGVEYTLAQNIPGNSLHGGTKGWDKRIWEVEVRDDAVWMTLLSRDGEEGYPGAVIATVKFSLTSDGKLVIKMTAVSTKATPINLTNHSYFNLFGHGGNATELYEHEITLNADRWTVTDSGSIPTGEIRSVANSIMDLRVAKRIGDVINEVPGGGYDYNFCIPEDNGPKGLRFVARVFHPSSGRYLEVYSDQPGVQLYTSNFLPDESATGVPGKNGQNYFKHGAFCLETQNYPDAVNNAHFPNSIIRPGEMYEHQVTYKFGVQYSKI